ncbi:hypothetical protein MXE38_11375 [Anaerobiospirillum sp. NML120448]|uniref:hypothetical protein n=1 Tax=Anaerobiospirillum sp. NML120448 TaxID=2932816 RepID=UPI001FF1C647|nr:hypothetical protein [Anaerobiospirillum sp. NML120448]MCK0515434.1 hypothetical protein [Anaerobiospirillum sp. NML120448]
MIRLMRLSSNDLAPQVANALSELGTLLQELKLDSSTSSLIAMSSHSGDYLNFNSNMSGSIKELTIEQGAPKFYKEQLHAAQNYSFRANKIIEVLKDKYPSLTSEDGSLQLSNKQNLSAPEFLYALISQPQYMLVINDREPVIIPFFSQEHCNNTLNNPQERLNAIKTVGVTSAILASFFASGSAAAANVQSSTAADSSNVDQKFDPGLQPSVEGSKDTEASQEQADSANFSATSSAGSAGAGASEAGSGDAGTGAVGAGTNAVGAEGASAAGASAAGAGAGAGAAAAGRSLGGCLIPSLIALLLLLALLAFYFFKLYPWPFDKANEQELLLDQLNEQVIEDELNLNKINELIEKTQEKIALGQQDAQEQQLANLKATLAKDEQTLKEIERLLGLVNDKDEQIKAEELAKAQEEAAKEAEAEAAAKAAEEAKLAQGAGKVTLPKCETIVKQGKMPNLIIATDGSGSMINLLSDGSMRIDAAIKAAHALIDQVDKNVPIRLFGIQGCPLARDYGTFSGNERQRLKAAVAQTNPMLQSIPFQVLTPLVSGMRGMASAAPKNADSIGVLISDGVDTCDGTEDLNLCEVARQIHKSKPRLKIHVVLIGEDAPDAKCIADITGGKVYKPGNTKALIEDLKNAGKSLQKVCQ